VDIAHAENLNIPELVDKTLGLSNKSSKRKETEYNTHTRLPIISAISGLKVIKIDNNILKNTLSINAEYSPYLI
jgi:hypothetical protein